LAVAAALVGVASLLTTIFVAHVLTTREYGTLVVLLGLFLVLSMPGSALLVGVVRRISSWEARGMGERVHPWVRRVHRVGELVVVALAVVMWLVRVPVAHALSLPSPSGVMEILTAGGVWVLVSIDRGLLQVRQDYVHLSVNLVIEASARTVLTVALAAELGVEGAALGLLMAELLTAGHARYTSRRALARPSTVTTGSVDSSAIGPLAGIEAPGGVVALAVHSRRDLVADVLTALGSLALLALLQNTDVILLGSRAPHNAGAYAAISVPSKALVFGALVLANYLLPEATIRHQQGAHALRQLGYTLAVLALPSALLLALSVLVPRQLLGAVFGHHLTAAAPAFSTLVGAMILLSVTVVLSVYLLGVGWRWVVAILAVGTGVLATLVARADGHILSTARADLVAQAVLCAAMVVMFVTVNVRARRPRTETGVDSAVVPRSVA
jgi:O-antigen/teichoic acid export membrane protein